MVKALTPSEQAYNRCVDAKNLAWTELLEALGTYNRAALAAETLFPLRLYQKATLKMERF